MSDSTRRDWLITISTVAAGASVAQRLQGDTEFTMALPPGLYGPSRDHLSHALMNAELYHPVPPGCPTEYVRPRTAPFEPKFFSASEFKLIRRVVQMILGETSDSAEGVEETAEWIDLRVSESSEVTKAVARLDPLRRALAVTYYGAAKADRLGPDDSAKTCREGLEWMRRRSRTFFSLSPADQTAIVQEMSEGKLDTPEGRFFSLLKTETIKGFYTSRTGLKELDYKGNAFFARSPGCSA